MILTSSGTRNRTPQLTSAPMDLRSCKKVSRGSSHGVKDTKLASSNHTAPTTESLISTMDKKVRLQCSNLIHLKGSRQRASRGDMGCNGIAAIPKPSKLQSEKRTKGISKHEPEQVELHGRRFLVRKTIACPLFSHRTPVAKSPDPEAHFQSPIICNAKRPRPLYINNVRYLRYSTQIRALAKVVRMQFLL